MIRKLYLVLILTVLNTFAQGDGTHRLAAEEVAKVNEVLDANLSTFNAKDLRGWEGTYHFPHYRLADIRILLCTSPSSTLFLTHSH